MAEQTYAVSKDILDAIEIFEGLERAGTIRPDEQKALDNFRNQQKTAQQVEEETVASYRGMQAGASLNAADEIVGAFNFANELRKNGDIEGSKQVH